MVRKPYPSFLLNIVNCSTFGKMFSKLLEKLTDLSLDSTGGTRNYFSSHFSPCHISTLVLRYVSYFPWCSLFSMFASEVASAVFNVDVSRGHGR